MTSESPKLLPARMLNEYAYCPRLFHLEWVQREWSDSADTVEGTHVHRRVDRPLTVNGPAAEEEAPTVARSVHLSDEQLRMVAVVDLVEHVGSDVVPVDFKRGSVPDVPEQAYEPERVQLCAQGLLLRANGHTCHYGYLYFAASRRRVRVDFDDALVVRTLELRDEALVAAEGPAPTPLIDSPKCPRCALVGICLPDEHNMISGRSTSPGRRIIPPREDALPLHVNEQGAVIGKNGRELVVKTRAGDKQRFRLIDVSSVHVHGNIQITTGAHRALMSSGVPTAFYSQGSWYYGRSAGHDHKNVLARIGQFAAAANPDQRLTLARRFVTSKVRNSRVFLRRNATGDHDGALDALKRAAESANRASGLSTLLGIEGHAARIYFEVFPSTLRHDAGRPFDFRHRNRRPPKDPVNALLSLTYSLLTSTWTNTLAAIGLDPYLGFYHQAALRPSGSGPRSHGGVSTHHCGLRRRFRHQSRHRGARRLPPDERRGEFETQWPKARNRRLRASPGRRNPTPVVRLPDGLSENLRRAGQAASAIPNERDRQLSRPEAPMSERTVYIVAYDICDPRRLRNVYRLMRGYGEHWQYSVFKCELTPVQKAKLISELSAVIHDGKDQVLLAPLGPPNGTHAGAIQTLGVPLPRQARSAYIV